MKFKFVFSDIVLFYKISNKLVNIDLPNYVTRIEPQDVKKVTRSTKASADGIDKSKYRCKVMPKVNSFRDSYFYRTVEQWNKLPLKIRDIDDMTKFKDDLKEHLWLILGLKPD